MKQENNIPGSEQKGKDMAFNFESLTVCANQRVYDGPLHLKLNASYFYPINMRVKNK